MSDITFSPTNLFASTNFDVLKMDAVEDPLININKLATLDLEECYFESAIDFINETNNNIANAKSELYKAISESTSNEIVLESFTDYLVKVKDIIKKFLKFLKSLFMRFLTSVNKLISSDKYIEKHKKDIDSFMIGDTFKINGYNYTFDPNIPLVNAILEYNYSLFNDLWNNIKHNDLSIESIKDAISSLNLEDDYSIFRGKVLNKDEKIYVGDFANELFKIFRDNELNTKEITVDKKFIVNAKDRYFSYSDTKRNINDLYSQIERAYNTVEKQLKELIARNGDLNAQAFIDRLPSGSNLAYINGKDISTSGMYIPANIMSQIDIYVNAKIDQIKNYSDIHTLAFAAKLDALKECYRQDKVILYTAISKTQRTDAAREVI